MALKTLKPGKRLKKIGCESKRVKRSVNGPANTWGNARTYQWRKLREEMLIDQKCTCQNCGRVRLPSELDVDHIVNVAAGGSMYDKANLQLLCRDTCHKEKTAKESKEAQHGYVNES